MIAIVDYGVGNLFSLACSFDAVGAEAVVTGDAEVIRAADRVVLPGVGAFEDAARKLRESGLDRVITEEAAAGKPLLGVCLGMQLLFERSREYGVHEGLGLIPGEIVPISGALPQGSELKIPQIGWNALRFPSDKPKSRLFAGLEEGDCVYFVHSYYAATPPQFVSATTEYGAELTAAAERGNVFGTQFHPEKSGRVGLTILSAFAEL
ncbi:MAG: imidazole glycerol phosphate synthase subunit HisH [Clostridia bacterium]|nr:imidazole glycerol phosphate synthase subunit HisH [Clostridia bacterium]